MGGWVAIQSHTLVLWPEVAGARREGNRFRVSLGIRSRASLAGVSVEAVISKSFSLSSRYVLPTSGEWALMPYSNGSQGWSQHQQHPLISGELVRNGLAPPCPLDSGEGAAVLCAEALVRTSEPARVYSNTQSLEFCCACDLRQPASGVAFGKVRRSFLTFFCKTAHCGYRGWSPWTEATCK